MKPRTLELLLFGSMHSIGVVLLAAAAYYQNPGFLLASIGVISLTIMLENSTNTPEDGS